MSFVVKKYIDIEGLAAFLDNKTLHGDFGDQFVNEMKNLFDNENTTRIFPNLFRLLWHSATPCEATAGINEFPLLKVGLSSSYFFHLLSQKCFWKGEEMNCSQLFKAVPTDSGMCCSFNLALSLADSEYSRLLDHHGGEPRAAAGKAMVGRSKGLTLLLDQHSNQKSFGSLARDSRGMQVPRSFPSP